MQTPPINLSATTLHFREHHYCMMDLLYLCGSYYLSVEALAAAAAVKDLAVLVAGRVAQQVVQAGE
jgi:hypothetical protein